MPDASTSIIARTRAPIRTRVIDRGGWWLANVGAVLLLASLVVYGGLYFYRRSLEDTRSSWLEQIKNQEAELRPDLLDQLIDLSNALSAGRELLSNHVVASQLFTFLQGVTHAKVQFSSFSFSLSSRKIDLPGVAASYRTVTEQVKLLESHPQVENVEFGGLSRSGQGLVSFRLAVTIKPGLLRFGGR